MSDGKKDMTSEEVMESMKPLMMLVFYFMDKVKRFRLSREAKAKADKNRSKVSTEQLSLFSKNLKETVQNAYRESLKNIRYLRFFYFSFLAALYPCLF